MDNNQQIVQPPFEQSTPLQATPQQPVSPPIVPPRKKLNKIIIIVSALVIVLIIIALLLLFLNKKESDSAVSSAIKPTVSIQTPTLVPTKMVETPVVVTLDKGKETQIPDTDITLKFVERAEPPKNCNDCYATTQVDMKQAGKTINLSYVCGGIAGVCTREADGDGYSVELVENLYPNVIKVSVKKK